MLQLNIEQIEALMALQRRRDLQQLCRLLAACFPEAAGRLGAGLADLVALGVQRGQAHGLRHALSLARYLACWFVLGAEFENRPGQEWARSLLQDARRREGAKVFQLCRRAREFLAARSSPRPGNAPAPDVAALDCALDQLDGALKDRGVFGALQRGPRLVLGQACDIDELLLRMEAADRHHYQFDHGTWTRGRQPASPVTLRIGQADPDGRDSSIALSELPRRLWLLAPGEGGSPTRLRVRCLAADACDPATHPLVRCTVAGRAREWRGPLAAEALLATYASTPGQSSERIQPVLAPPTLARLGHLSAGACGLRDRGAPFGDAAAELVIQPAEQHLMVWQREGGAALEWTEAEAPSPVMPRTQVRIERDGQPLDPGQWRSGWDDLDRQMVDGLGRLFGAWRRGNGLERCTVQATPALLTGEAGVCWGWIESDTPLQAPPRYRLKVNLSAIACRLDLLLGGEIELMGARARLRMRCAGVVPLQVEAEAWGDDGPHLAPDFPGQLGFELPFVLAAEALASPQAALLHAGPAFGGLVGKCGLRRRQDGQGLQWFAQLTVEPVTARMHLESPWMGRSTVECTLLPAMPLVDWSLG